MAYNLLVIALKLVFIKVNLLEVQLLFLLLPILYTISTNNI